MLSTLLLTAALGQIAAPSTATPRADRAALDLLEAQANVPEFRGTKQQRVRLLNRATVKVAGQIMARHALSLEELGKIANRLANDPAELDRLKTQYTVKRGDPAPPLQKGTARAPIHICACGAELTIIPAVRKPEQMRHVEDVRIFPQGNHAPDDHTNDTQNVLAHALPIDWRTPLQVLEFVPAGSGFFQRKLWVRATTREGKTLYLQATSLRNFDY